MDPNIQQAPVQNIPSPIPPTAPMPEPPRTFGWFKWVLIILVVALVSSGTTYLVLQQSQKNQQLNQLTQITPTPSPSEVSTKEETANWKTYTNTVLQYSFKYPAEFKIEQDQSNAVSLIYIAPRSYQLEPNNFASFSISVVDNKTMVQAAEDLKSEIQQYGGGGMITNISPLNKTLIDNKEAVYYTFIQKTYMDTKMVFIDLNGKVLEVGHTYAGPDEEVRKKYANWVNQILSTFKFLDQTQTNADESRVRELISNFYQAFEKQDGELLFGYITPPITSQEKGEYSWLTGVNLDSDAFYRAFLRVKLSNPSIKNMRRLDDKRFEINAVDEFQSYSQVSAQWNGPTVRNVKFTVIKTPAGWWLIDKFIWYERTGSYKASEKYSGFPNVESNN